MEVKYLIHVLILVSCCLGAWGGLPPEIEKCKSTDNDDCIAKNILKVLQLYPHGYAEMGLPDVSSIVVKDIVLSESKRDSPIQLNFKFNTLTVKGLETLKILRVHGFNKNLTKSIEIEFLIPKITIDGDYEINGKLLLLPLNGKGLGNIALKDVYSKYKVKVQVVNRNNTNYGVIDKIQLKELDPKKMIFNLQNIVNNNAILSESINGVINENWSDLWLEIKSNTIRYVEDIIRNILNDILKELPVDEFYLD
ncbi:circadian clock-controlled protein daywake-like [Calliphora vicina]|uniref:circadian clock-controlled protein daywake-like n=1 Tax=Calliphora vicina TaxID=7373 RepID=UPI00325B13C1